MLVKNLLAKGVVLVATVTLSTAANATHAWSIYHWARTSNPFTLQVTDHMTSEWQSALTGSLDRWSDPSGSYLDALDFSLLPGTTDSKVRRRCNPNSGEIAVCNLSYGNTGWLGIASINIDSNGHITRGSAKMNDFYSSYWELAGERNHVVCQEIGHLFGLGHQSENFDASLGTCMDYSSDPASQWPNDHDYEELEIIYDHLDDYNSYAGGNAGGDGGSCNAPPGKGCNKAGVPAEIPMGVPLIVGRNYQIWVATDGRGGYWIHHVRLVPDAYRHP